MSGDFIKGAVALLAVGLSCGLAGRNLRRLALPAWDGPPAALASSILAIGTLVVVSEVVGLVGLLGCASLIAGTTAVAVVSHLLARRSRAARDEGDGAGPGEVRCPAGALEAPGEHPVAVAVALVLAAIVVAQWAVPTLVALDRGIYGGDSLWYHMPFAAHIAQTGSITELLYTDPLYLNWFYPEVSELVHADALTLFGGDFLSPLINMAWLALALLAGWCAGRPRGAAAPAMAAVASLMAADLMFSRQPGNANNDVVAIALLLSAVAILMNLRAGAQRRLLLGVGVAGLAAGLALGTKLTVVAPVGALTVGVIAIAARGDRIRTGLAWSGGLALGGGVWYLRNLIVSGNPLPFVGIGPLDKVAVLGGREPFSVAHYATDTSVWGRYFQPGLAERFGELWPLVLAVTVAGVIVALSSRAKTERMLGAVALVAAIAYILTPLSASGVEGMPVGFRLNIRYLAPALSIALVLAAIPPVRLGERFAGIWKLTALVVFAALILFSHDALDPLDGDRLAGTLLLVGIFGLLPAALLAAGPHFRVPRRVLAVGAGLILIPLGFIGDDAMQGYEAARYDPGAPDFPAEGEHPSAELELGLKDAYGWARGTGGERVALSGTLGALYQYGLWGPDAGNDVEFLGRRGPRGTFEEITDCGEYVAALNAGGYDELVTTPAYDQDDPSASVAPAARALMLRAGVERVPFADRTGLVDIWKLDGPVDVAACASTAKARKLP